MIGLYNIRGAEGGDLAFSRHAGTGHQPRNCASSSSTSSWRGGGVHPSSAVVFACVGRYDVACCVRRRIVGPRCGLLQFGQCGVCRRGSERNTPSVEKVFLGERFGFRARLGEFRR